MMVDGIVIDASEDGIDVTGVNPLLVNLRRCPTIIDARNILSPITVKPFVNVTWEIDE